MLKATILTGPKLKIDRKTWTVPRTALHEEMDQSGKRESKIKIDAALPSCSSYDAILIGTMVCS